MVVVVGVLQHLFFNSIKNHNSPAVDLVDFVAKQRVNDQQAGEEAKGKTLKMVFLWIAGGKPDGQTASGGGAAFTETVFLCVQNPIPSRGSWPPLDGPFIQSKYQRDTFCSSPILHLLLAQVPSAKQMMMEHLLIPFRDGGVLAGWP